MRRGDRNVPLVTAIAAAIVALVLALVHMRAAALPGVAAIEGLTIDARFKLRGPRAPASDRIVVVGLDDDLRRDAPDVIQTRRGYARFLDALARYHPKLVAFDLFFSSPEVVLPDALAARVKALHAAMAAEPDSEAKQVIGLVDDELRGDEALAAAIARVPVYLGALFVLGAPVTAAEDPGVRKARHGEVADAGGGGKRRPATAARVIATLPEIGHAAAGAGAVNNFRDEDGVTRSMPLAIEHGGRLYMALGLAVALAELGQPQGTEYVAGASTMTAAGRELPLSEGAALRLDVLGKNQIPRISGAAVLAGTAPREALEGKLVFVGITYSAFDKIATPLDRVADGVELHATLAENILGGRLLRSTGDLATLLATFVLCAIVCAAQLRRVRRRPWVPPLIALGAFAIYVAVAVLMFSRGTVIAIALPVVLASCVVVAATIGGLATEGRDKARLRAVFSQYVSGPVVDRILADPARARLGGERKELTVLFSDIRGFSLFAEQMPPVALATFLGEYLTPMTELVLASGGTLDKYIGDAIMAIWGAPIDDAAHAAHACEVALRMQEMLGALNTTWAAQGKPAVAIGIGINTGPMAVGNMGSAARFDYTVLGDQVNLASRLEALTKEYGVGILVGEATARAAQDAFVFREIDLVRVKGRAGAVPVFELCGRKGRRLDPAFPVALAAYRAREFAAAHTAFASLAALTDDPVARIMAARCQVLAEAPPPEDWDGVYDQRSK